MADYKITTKSNAQFFGEGANIDANFGPWNSIAEYEQWRQSKNILMAIAEGTVIAVYDAQQRLGKYIYFNGSWHNEVDIQNVVDAGYVIDGLAGAPNQSAINQDLKQKIEKVRADYPKYIENYLRAIPYYIQKGEKATKAELDAIAEESSYGDVWSCKETGMKYELVSKIVDKTAFRCMHAYLGTTAQTVQKEKVYEMYIDPKVDISVRSWGNIVTTMAQGIKDGTIKPYETNVQVPRYDRNPNAQFTKFDLYFVRDYQEHLIIFAFPNSGGTANTTATNYPYVVTAERNVKEITADLAGKPFVEIGAAIGTAQYAGDEQLVKAWEPFQGVANASQNGLMSAQMVKDLRQAQKDIEDLKLNGGGGNTETVTVVYGRFLTQSQYDALEEKEENMPYFIMED